MKILTAVSLVFGVQLLSFSSAQFVKGDLKLVGVSSLLGAYLLLHFLLKLEIKEKGDE